LYYVKKIGGSSGVKLTATGGATIEGTTDFTLSGGTKPFVTVHLFPSYVQCSSLSDEEECNNATGCSWDEEEGCLGTVGTSGYNWNIINKS
jgi:hypothetical protein